ncbi:neuropeptide FF receptor 1-like [Thalassophryne amazonica]|uniref:neuropeptide FF receptor 1-like n=1 Tax=Thalassophryne amazonica TaxID=390379 RepID=UPI001470BC4A|nr:neuropeptide FF receptor 1-like [Thalassophryne amazonica]
MKLQSEAQVETLFLMFNCILLTLTFIFGLLWNVWVCWVVFKTKSLQTCNNALLVNLAIADLMKCCVDAPLLLFSFVRYGKDRPGSVPLCSLQQFTYALCSCVQLLTLVSISVERFQTIAFPFQKDGTKARIRFWILSIWACGLILAVVSLTLSKQALFYMLCSWHVRDHREYLDPFGPYVLVPLWGLSLTVITVHYVRIFKVIRHHRKKVFNQGVQLRPMGGEHGGWAGVPASAPRTAPLPAVADAGASCADAPSEIVGAVCLLCPGARERSRKHLEGKVAQRFGYLIMAFTLFWVPMVVILLMNIISSHDTHELLTELETSAVVLSCVQAAVDPLIYTLVMRPFRSELAKMMSCLARCPVKLRRM